MENSAIAAPFERDSESMIEILHFVFSAQDFGLSS